MLSFNVPQYRKYLTSRLSSSSFIIVHNAFRNIVFIIYSRLSSDWFCYPYHRELDLYVVASYARAKRNMTMSRRAPRSGRDIWRAEIAILWSRRTGSPWAEKMISAATILSREKPKTGHSLLNISSVSLLSRSELLWIILLWIRCRPSTQEISYRWFRAAMVSEDDTLGYRSQ